MGHDPTSKGAGREGITCQHERVDDDLFHHELRQLGGSKAAELDKGLRQALLRQRGGPCCC